MQLKLAWIVCWATALACGASAAGEIVSGAVAEEIDRDLSDRVPRGLNCVVLAARDGKVLLSKGYGWANADKTLPWTPGTVFDIGSITKQFTAAAIAALVEEGKLSFDDPLEKHLGPIPEDKRSITLHHLLTHTAGLTDILGGDYDVMSREQLVERALRTPLRHPVGEKHLYSNVGYSLLAAVVEQTARTSYEHYLAQRLWEPSGLRLTGYRLPKWFTAQTARGVTMAGKDWGSPLDQRWSETGPYWNLLGNGGILSTAEDLYRWHRALAGNAVLSDTIKQKLFRPYVAETASGRSHYGYGWSVATTVRNTRTIMHNGGNGVFSADFRRYTDENAIVIMGSSDARCNVDRVKDLVLAKLFPDPPPARPR